MEGFEEYLEIRLWKSIPQNGALLPQIVFSLIYDIYVDINRLRITKKMQKPGDFLKEEIYRIRCLDYRSCGVRKMNKKILVLGSIIMSDIH